MNSLCSEVSKRGWREEILHMPEIQASFLHPVSYAPLGEGGHISGERFLALFGGLFVANPLLPTLFETSDSEVGAKKSTQTFFVQS